MRELALHLREHVPTSDLSKIQKEQWARVDSELAKSPDLESALALSEIEEGLINLIVQLTAAIISERERQAIERIVKGEEALSLSSLLPHITYSNGRAEIVTTNYDRLIEFAAEVAGYGVDTTFAGTVFGRFDPSLSRDALSEFKVSSGGRRELVKRRYRPHVAVYKPHGSLDWYLRQGEPVRCWAPVNGQRLMITPGSSKFRKGYDRPFDYHREQANAAIDAAAGFLIIGYGFNDDQLETHLRQRLQAGYPCLILTRTLTDKAKNVVCVCPSVTALVRGCEHGTNGTGVITCTETAFFPDVELWDLKNFVKEVLGA